MVDIEMTPTLSILIVNWNGADFLPNCIRSIVENPPSVEYEISVVDNASADKSLMWLRSGEARAMVGKVPFRVIESEENLGFGRANNLLFDQTEAENLLLLNPDTLVTAGAIDKMLHTLLSEDRIGMVGPRLLNLDGTVQPSVWGYPPSPASILVEGLKLHRLVPRSFLSEWLFARHWDYARRTRVPIIAAAAVLVRREMIKEIGGFDESFHMYGEDIEWCIRASKSNWNIVFEPEAEIFHIGRLSSKQRWTELELANVQEQSSIRLFERHLSRPRMFFNSLVNAFIACVHLASWRINGKSTEALLEQVRMHLRAARAAMLGPADTYLLRFFDRRYL